MGAVRLRGGQPEIRGFAVFGPSAYLHFMYQALTTTLFKGSDM